MTGVLLDLSTWTDARGVLTFMEPGTTIPFPIRLVYYMHSAGPGVRRGNHAHRELREVLIPVAGAVSVRLENRSGTVTHRMVRPNQGLLIEPMTWIELYDFTPDAVVLFLASHAYDEADNIRDRAAFEMDAGLR